jgi:hypothetical protein
MPNDFEIIKLVRANPVAQAMFFRIILKLFRTFSCGFSSSNQYSRDVYANGKPMGVFGPMVFVTLKAKESGRMAQHAYCLI